MIEPISMDSPPMIGLVLGNVMLGTSITVFLRHLVVQCNVDSKEFRTRTLIQR